MAGMMPTRLSKAAANCGLQAYIWNFYAASQIVLRESLVDMIEYAAVLQERSELGEQGMQIIQKQREWVDVLSGVIIASVPQLLGFTYQDDQGRRPQQAQQGRMAGRLFALFSMWVVQRAKFTSPQHKQTAAEVVSWINSPTRAGLKRSFSVQLYLLAGTKPPFADRWTHIVA